MDDFERMFYKPTKIAVCTAWGSPFSWTHSDYNLMNLARPEGVAVRYFPGFGRDPGRRHMYGVEKALEWNASHICFLGADQLHDEDILVKFTKHITDGWAAVTAWIPSRSQIDLNGDGNYTPFPRCAWKWKRNGKENIMSPRMNFDYLEPIKEEDGPLQEVVVIGSGAFMFCSSLLGVLEKPWFREKEADDNGNRPAVMDTGFVWRLSTQLGVRILLDLTIKVYHLDVFPIDETFTERFKDWKLTEEEKKSQTILSKISKKPKQEEEPITHEVEFFKSLELNG